MYGFSTHLLAEIKKELLETSVLHVHTCVTIITLLGMFLQQKLNIWVCLVLLLAVSEGLSVTSD